MAGAGLCAWCSLQTGLHVYSLENFKLDQPESSVGLCSALSIRWAGVLCLYTWGTVNVVCMRDEYVSACVFAADFKLD